MGKHQSWTGAVPLKIKGDPHQRANDFPVKAFVVDNLRCRHCSRTQARNGGVGKLSHVAGCEIVDPEVGRLH